MVEDSVLNKDTFPKYRYLYSFSRLDSGKIKYDRTNGKEGMILIQDSRPNKNDTDDTLDYHESIRIKEIDELDGNEFELKINVDDYHWTHLTLWRTLNINAPDATKATVENMFVWVNDIPLIRIAEILPASAYQSVIEDTAYSTKRIKVSDGCFNKSCVGETIYSFDNTTLEQEASSIIIRYEEDGNYLTILLKTNDAQYFTDGYIVSTSESIKKGTKTGYQYYNYFLLRDTDGPTERCQILWETGNTAIGIKETNAGGLDRLYGKEISSIVSNSIDYYQTFSRSYTVNIKDNVTDDTLLSRIERDKGFYILQTRYFDEIPNNNISAVKAGAYFCSTGNNEYLYSSTNPIERLGTYHPAYQKHKINEGNITRLRNYPDSIILFGQHFTKTIGVDLVQNAGTEEFGEYIAQFLSSQLITGRIGCLKNIGQAEVDKFEIILTNENKIMLFDGYKYNENMAQNIQSVVNKMGAKVFLLWNPIRGLLAYSSPKQSE